MTREIRHRERGAERERTPIFAMTFKHYDETSTVRRDRHDSCRMPQQSRK